MTRAPLLQVVLASIAQPECDYGKEAKGACGRGASCRGYCAPGNWVDHSRSLGRPQWLRRTGSQAAAALSSCAGDALHAFQLLLALSKMAFR